MAFATSSKVLVTGGFDYNLFARGPFSSEIWARGSVSLAWCPTTDVSGVEPIRGEVNPHDHGGAACQHCCKCEPV